VVKPDLLTNENNYREQTLNLIFFRVLQMNRKDSKHWHLHCLTPGRKACWNQPSLAVFRSGATNGVAYLLIIIPPGLLNYVYNYSNVNVCLNDEAFPWKDFWTPAPGVTSEILIPSILFIEYSITLKDVFSNCWPKDWKFKCIWNSL